MLPLTRVCYRGEKTEPQGLVRALQDINSIVFSFYPLYADITYAHFFPLVITTDTWGQILNVPKKEGDKPSPAENHWIQLDPHSVRNQVSDSPGSVHSKKIFRIV